MANLKQLDYYSYFFTFTFYDLDTRTIVRKVITYDYFELCQSHTICVARIKQNETKPKSNQTKPN